ncbi:hypothetical protein V5799_033408 [Amblyomma americanum]|uniref:Uncharacterized protein n=1 Tax=Amblyomma americanum TaxID=6943 RepID=A0AAQ4DND9_AMBAM
MLATQLAEEGFFVYAGCLDEDGDGAKLLRKHGNILVMQMNVTKHEELNRALQIVKNTIGGKGRITIPECLAYCMSKVSCTSLADGLRRQYYNRGIHVCTIEPSGYRTPIANHDKLGEILDRDVQLLPEGVRRTINGRSIARCKHTADVLYSLVMSERPQEAVDAMKLAIRERLPRTCYRPGGLRDCLLQWLHDIAPIEMADEVIDAIRRISVLVKRK